MALSQLSASLSLSIGDVTTINTSRTQLSSRLPTSKFVSSTFALDFPYRKAASKTASISIRCEQSTQGSNSLNVWLGRLAMVGFAVGRLENFGVTAPLPTVALAVTGLVGVLTAVFIFQSASKN